jgi:V8-like Glu-specific endopeptidase
MLALVVLVAACTADAQNVLPKVDKGPLPEHPTLEQIASTVKMLYFEKGGCSGTAISAHTILTAKHCIALAGKLTDINKEAATTTAIVENKDDTVVLTIKDSNFPAWAVRGPAAKVGDHLRWFGMPLGHPNVYREGYVAALIQGIIVMNATVCHGDSGSGLFNSDGQVVGVVSAIVPYESDNCSFMLAMPAP